MNISVLTQLMIIGWVFLILFLPGVCVLVLLRDKLFRQPGNTRIDSIWFSIPLSFSISTSLVSSTALIAYAFDFGLDWVRSVILLLTLCLLVGVILIFVKKIPSFVHRKQDTYPIRNYLLKALSNRIRRLREKVKTGNFLSIKNIRDDDRKSFIYFLIVILSMSFAMYTGPYLSKGADTLYHMAVTRSLLVTHNPIPQEIFSAKPKPYIDPNSGTWNTAMALVADLAQVDPLHVMNVLHAIIAGLFALTLAIFTLETSRRLGVVFWAVFLFFTIGGAISIRSILNPNLMGQIPFWCILLLMIRYVRIEQPDTGADETPRTSYFLSFLGLIGFVAFNLSAIHVQYSPVLIGLLFGCLGLVFLASLMREAFPLTTGFLLEGKTLAENMTMGQTRWTKGATKKVPEYKQIFLTLVKKIQQLLTSGFFRSSLVAIVATLPLFVYRSIIVINIKAVTSSGYGNVVAKTVFAQKDPLSALHYKYYFSYEVIYVLTFFLLIGLLVYWLRGETEGIMIMSGVLLAPASALVLGNIIGTGELVLTTIGRLVRVMVPTLYILWAWQLCQAFEWIRQSKLPLRISSMVKLGLALIIIFASISPIITGCKEFIKIYSPYSTNYDGVAVGKAAQLTWKNPGVFNVIKALPSGSVVLSDTTSSHELSCYFANVIFINKPRRKLPLQERLDFSIENSNRMLDFVTGTLSNEDQLELLETLDIDYVYVDKEVKYGQESGETFWNLLPVVPNLNLIYEGDTWRLYEFQPD